MPDASANPETRASAKFIEVFRARAGGSAVLPFDRFMALALYHDEVGYYRRDRARVGRGPGTDFYTATTSGPLFGELIAAACAKLLGTAAQARASALAPSNYEFVELGAERGRGVLEGVPHPFRRNRIVGVGEAIELRGACVVFSNELFDAQPFRRFVFQGGAWRELGVTLDDGALTLTETIIEGGDALPAHLHLPATAPEGYHLDLPLAAATLLGQIAAQPWTGIFVAFDYGKSWRELIEATPAGTARAYFRHTQSNGLLAQPGEQDLTCHVCWDWLAATLERHGFAAPPPAVESQESFFIHHAADFIGRTVAAEAARLSPRKLALMQLLHPAHLGQKFQVLHAVRA